MPTEPNRLPADKATRLAGISRTEFEVNPDFYLQWLVANDCDLLVRGAKVTDHFGLSIVGAPVQPSNEGDLPYVFRRPPAKVDRAAFVALPGVFLAALRDTTDQAEISLEDGRRIVISAGDLIGFTMAHHPEMLKSIDRAEEDFAAGRGKPIGDVMAELKAEQRAQRRALFKEIRRSSPRQLAVMASTRGPQAVATRARHTWWTTRLRVGSTVNRVHARLDPVEKRDQRLQRKLDAMAKDVNALS